MIRAILLGVVATLGVAGGAGASERWVCYGSPLNNPMGRVICGTGWSEAEARNQCGFDVVNILCQRSGSWGPLGARGFQTRLNRPVWARNP